MKGAHHAPFSGSDITSRHCSNYPLPFTGFPSISIKIASLAEDTQVIALVAHRMPDWSAIMSIRRRFRNQAGGFSVKNSRLNRRQNSLTLIGFLKPIHTITSATVPMWLAAIRRAITSNAVFPNVIAEFPEAGLLRRTDLVIGKRLQQPQVELQTVPQ